MAGVRSSARLAAVTALSLLVAPSATADRGVALDIGRIDVGAALAPGGSYRLPTFGVRNPGDQPTSYRLRVWPIRGEARAPDPAWVRFTPGHVTLRPNEVRKVQARLVLPSDATAGDYSALIGPEIVAAGRGATVGGAAAARLSFTVEERSGISLWWHRLTRFLGDHLPWTALVPALALAALAVDRARRRYRISVVRRP